jgi:hypothetical protein
MQSAGMTGEMLMRLMQGLLPGMTAEVPVQPIDDAAPEPAPEPAVVAGAGEAAVPLNVPMCVFCREDLGRLSVEALMCGHAFHTTCIDEYIAATNKSRLTCCPFKCHVHALLVADNPDEGATEPESPAGVQDEPVDDATANLALAVAAEAEANIF